MSESLDGLSVAATRQNAGRVLAPSPPRPPPRAPGCVKPPAGTVSADVIVVSGSFSEARLSHVVAAVRVTGGSMSALNRIDTAETKTNTDRTRFIVSLLPKALHHGGRRGRGGANLFL